MKLLFNLITALCLSCPIIAQETPTPLEVVQQQLDTYNAQDIDGFAAVFAEDAQVYSNLGDEQPSMVGREAIHQRYGTMFEKNPMNRSVLKGRMVQGNYVFDHEWITGRADAFSIVAIYEVTDGLISRCWFVR